MGNDMFGVDIHNENEPLRMLENRDHQFDSQSGGDQRNAGSRDGTLLIKGPIFGRLNGQQKYTDKYKKKLEKFHVKNVTIFRPPSLCKKKITILTSPGATTSLQK